VIRKKKQPERGRIRQRRDKAAAAAVRGAAVPGSVLASAAVLQAAHVPPAPWGWIAAGGVATWYCRDAADAIRERRSGGRRAARQRRRFQGTATASEIRGSLSVSAARKQARVTRPSLAGARGLPAAEVGVAIGTGGRPRRTLMAGHEDFILLFGAPRTGKTGVECDWLADAPGAAISTTTRVDTFAHTALPRAARGPLWVLNPDGDGDLPTNFMLSPLAGCHVPQIAIESAGYLQHAAPSDKGGKDAHWDQRGAELLRLAMHAAAIAGATMREVAEWVRDPSSPEFTDALCSPAAAEGWAAKLGGLRRTAAETLDGVIAAAESAVSWMDDPFMAMVACPGPRDAEFDAAEFICSAGTLYLIAADKPHGSVAPYCAWMTAHIWLTAKRLASRSPGSRLDPPLTMVLDEPAITCPVPIDKWSAEAGGHGITIITGVQSPAQLSARWGENGARTIRDNATVQLILRGKSDHDELEKLSALCGERDTWHHARGPGGSRTRQPAKERLFPPERIRTLKPWQAILLHRSTRPLIARLTPVWERPGYQRAPLGAAVLQAQHAAARAPQPAIEAPREPIAMPPAPASPPVVEDAAAAAIEENRECLSTPEPATSRSRGMTTSS
jgi:type IV secretion system protein VirD4